MRWGLSAEPGRYNERNPSYKAVFEKVWPHDLKKAKWGNEKGHLPAMQLKIFSRPFCSLYDKITA